MNSTITTVSLSKSLFVQTAGKMTIVVGTTAIEAQARTFSNGAGNVGWHFNAKVAVTPGESIVLYINGTPIELDFGRFGNGEGSHGWGMNGTARQEMSIITESGGEFPVSIRGCVTCIHSKEWTEIPDGTVQAQVGIFVEVPGSKKWAA